MVTRQNLIATFLQMFRRDQKLIDIPIFLKMKFSCITINMHSVHISMVMNENHMDLRCNLCGETFEHDFSLYAHQPFPDMNVVLQPNC